MTRQTLGRWAVALILAVAASGCAKESSDRTRRDKEADDEKSEQTGVQTADKAANAPAAPMSGEDFGGSNRNETKRPPAKGTATFDQDDRDKDEFKYSKSGKTDKEDERAPAGSKTAPAFADRGPRPASKRPDANTTRGSGRLDNGLTRNKARRWTLRGSTAGPQVRAPGDARGSPPLPAKLTWHAEVPPAADPAPPASPTPVVAVRTPAKPIMPSAQPAPAQELRKMQDSLKKVAGKRRPRRLRRHQKQMKELTKAEATVDEPEELEEEADAEDGSEEDRGETDGKLVRELEKKMEKRTEHKPRELKARLKVKEKRVALGKEVDKLENLRQRAGDVMGNGRDESGVKDATIVDLERGRRTSTTDGQLSDEFNSEYRPLRTEEPESFIPDTCYFENTYLGGDAGHRHRLERLDRALRNEGSPHRLARPLQQGFEPPLKKGMGLSATLDERSFERKGRVYLQIGLQGSDRYGWRRPPLEVVLVVDPAAIRDDAEPARELIRSLVRQLGPQDRLGVVVGGSPVRRLSELGRLRTLRTELLPQLDQLQAATSAGSHHLGQELTRGLIDAGEMLQRAARRRTTLPGTQTVLLLTSGSDGARVNVAARFAAAAGKASIVTSVIELGPASSGAWWRVASSGHGNYHRVEAGRVGDAVKAELETLSKVVARLLRVNVKLAEGVKAVRVLGANILDQETVKQVKAREVAADKSLSQAFGIVADRGEDDDGIQSVIPYFYGGDAHVVVLELWVDRPGKVADVTLRYKDMVNLDNATARTSVYLRNVPRPLAMEQMAVRRNLRGFGLADVLGAAGDKMRAGDGHGALALLRSAEDRLTRGEPGDSALLSGLQSIIQRRNWSGDPQARQVIVEALELARRRKLGGAGGT